MEGEQSSGNRAGLIQHIQDRCRVKNKAEDTREILENTHTMKLKRQDQNKTVAFYDSAHRGYFKLLHAIRTKPPFVQYVFSHYSTFMLRGGGVPAANQETAVWDNVTRSLSVNPLDIFTLGSEYVSTSSSAPESTANVPFIMLGVQEYKKHYEKAGSGIWCVGVKIAFSSTRESTSLRHSGCPAVPCFPPSHADVRTWTLAIVQRGNKTSNQK